MGQLLCCCKDPQESISAKSTWGRRSKSIVKGKSNEKTIKKNIQKVSIQDQQVKKQVNITQNFKSLPNFRSQLKGQAQINHQKQFSKKVREPQKNKEEDKYIVVTYMKPSFYTSSTIPNSLREGYTQFSKNNIHQKPQSYQEKSANYDISKNELLTKKSKINQYLNSKFENTLADEIMDQKISEISLREKDYLNQGLPNIGYTCYLNSVLQLLFAAKILREQIIQISNKSPTTFHGLIAEVFKNITFKQANNILKQRNLRNLFNYLQDKEPNFSYFKQNDAIQCFLCIMNLLDEELPQRPKINYLKVEYQPRCKCTEESQYILTEFYVKSQQFCVKCNQIISFSILNANQFLLIVSDSKKKQFSQKIKLETKEYTLIYENHAFITYYGNSRSGHYISHRRIGSKWIQISDSNVRLVEYNFKSYSPMLTLYNLKSKQKRNKIVLC